MTNTKEKDWLDAILEQKEEEVDDLGFSARVMENLPKRTVSHKLRSLVVLGFTLVSCLLTFFVLPGGDYLWNTISEVFCFSCWEIAVPVSSLAMVLVIVFSTVSFAVAES
jgi:hypothetical protein